MVVENALTARNIGVREGISGQGRLYIDRVLDCKVWPSFLLQRQANRVTSSVKKLIGGTRIKQSLFSTEEVCLQERSAVFYAFFPSITGWKIFMTEEVAGTW